MGTRETNQDTKKVAKCSICRKTPRPDCEWRQGRCPHRVTKLAVPLITTIKNLFKGKK